MVLRLSEQGAKTLGRCRVVGMLLLFRGRNAEAETTLRVAGRRPCRRRRRRRGSCFSCALRHHHDRHHRRHLRTTLTRSENDYNGR